MAPIFSRNLVVITIHDIAFKSLKNVFTWKTVLWKSFITRLSIIKANKIISITNFTKEEILKLYPLYDFNPKIKEADIKDLEETQEFLIKNGMQENRIDINSIIAK